MYRLTAHIHSLRWLLFFLLVLSPSFLLRGQNRENLVKAGFVEKFTHFVEWPENRFSSDNPFRVTVIGEVGYARELKVLLEKARQQKIKIQVVQSPDQIGPCELLVISAGIGPQLDKVLHAVRNQPILTISDGSGFGKKGVMIQLFLKDEFVRYEVNLRSLNTSGLKMNSMLLRSASNIHDR